MTLRDSSTPGALTQKLLCLPNCRVPSSTPATKRRPGRGTSCSFCCFPFQPVALGIEGGLTPNFSSSFFFLTEFLLHIYCFVKAVGQIRKSVAKMLQEDLSVSRKEYCVIKSQLKSYILAKILSHFLWDSNNTLKMSSSFRKYKN